MPSLLSKTIVERCFAEKNYYDIWWAIRVAEKERKLPEEFWLFCRVYEWAPARSGVWQYYESLTDEQIKRISDALDRYGLTDIAEKYRLGWKTWDGPTQAIEVDRWLEQNFSSIYDAVFNLIVNQKDQLYV